MDELDHTEDFRECQNRWVTAHRPKPTTLTGSFIRLEPLADSHLAGLYGAIGLRSVFEFGFGGGLAAFPESLEEFRRWSAERNSPDNNAFVVIVTGGPHEGTIVGTTTLGDFDVKREATHIGWTGYDPRVWGTAVNPEAKLLLLQHAFDSGFGRVKIQTDALNLHSRAAIAKLGATFEGVVRREQIRADGTWRDTAQFSVVKEEWPQIREGLLSRLSAFEGRPVLFRTPRT